MNESDKDALLVRIAWAICDPRMSGPDGNAFGFCAVDYPEAPGAFGDTELDAACDFLTEMYPDDRKHQHAEFISKR